VLLLHSRLPSPRNVVPREGYVMNVWVEHAWRRKGIASALMEAALEKSRELGIRRVRLHATPEGRGAYARAGFVPREDGMERILS
jgi:ribosomal protein S18 acetylase RimI-like enzyme